ncbi:hypothetical protein ACFVW7_13520, partial [Streptomyces sp. NPDC058206]
GWVGPPARVPPQPHHPRPRGWQAAPRKGFLAKLTGTREIDLDASAVLFAGGHHVDVVFFQQLTSN